MATAASDSEVTQGDLEVIQFTIANRTYAIDVSEGNSIIEPKPTTRVPRASDAVEGVTDYRGEVAVIVDLREVLDAGSEEHEQNDDDRIIILDDEVDNQTVGVRVESVTGVEAYSSDDVTAVGQLKTDRDVDSDRVTGVVPLETEDGEEDGVDVVELLDIEAVLADVREESRLEVQQTK